MLTLDQRRQTRYPERMKGLAVMPEDVRKIFVVLSVTPQESVHRIVSRQEFLALQKDVLSWYEITNFDVNFTPSS